VVCATRGERGYAWKGGGLPPANPAVASLRSTEEQASCALLGATLEFLDLDDGLIFASREAVERVSGILRQRKPVMVFTHGPQDKPDHAALSILTLQALYRAGLTYETDLYMACEHASRQARSPDLFVDISPVIDAKRDQIACHESHHQHPGSIESLISVNADLGCIAGCAYAEAFLLGLPLIDARWNRDASPRLLRATTGTQQR
jgi:LmbE family N-acetylglucosaminyl deacetylase